MCQKPLRVVNPHYKKIAKAQHFDLRVFSGMEDYFFVFLVVSVLIV